MYTLILVLLVIDSIVLIGAVLLQAGKGGGLAATFGGAASSSDSFVGTRQAATLLTKASWWTGGLFIALAFLLQLMGQRSTAPKSVLDQTLTQPPAQAAPAPSSQSAVPLEPAAPTQKAPAQQTPTTPPKR